MAIRWPMTYPMDWALSTFRTNRANWGPLFEGPEISILWTTAVITYSLFEPRLPSHKKFQAYTTRFNTINLKWLFGPEKDHDGDFEKRAQSFCRCAHILQANERLLFSLRVRCKVMGDQK